MFLMNDMVFASLFPVFALLLLGHLLKRFGLTNEAFLNTSDRLIYFIFFPMLLFWKIGGADTESGPGKVRRLADGRRPSADHRWTPHHIAALYPARQRPANLSVAIETGTA